MSSAATGFYVTGGTLRQDAPSYVERQADRDLYEGLLHGEYCYVLHARQMGKSSLMVHTTARLRKAGVAVAAFELTALGQHLTVEQWYDGLLSRIGRELDLEDELEEYWLAHERLAPLQRWLGALEQVVLARGPGRIVLFLDEIDAVRSLPFSTDEFFAAIPECYNRRSQDPEFQRLTFCLLGVATPSDLIQETRTTPFNIGKRIELTDFTPAEAAPLAQGLSRDEARGKTLLERILHWTGGHPYLTQRLCQAVAADESASDAAGVDRLCAALFFAPRAQERDDNLLFVRERLLHTEAEPAALLDLYRLVRHGRRVQDDDTNRCISLLRLSGIVRAISGRLQVRNRIYHRVFDPNWITQHMPDAELRRQKAAYRRGLLRATAASAVLLSLMAGLSLTALHQARLARQQRGLAEERERTGRRYLYAAHMNLAQHYWELGNVARAQELLQTWQPQPHGEDLRGFEWRYLWRLTQQDAPVTLHGHRRSVFSLAYSPDGKLLASGSHDNTVKLWDTGSHQEVASLRGHKDQLAAEAFSPDGKRLLTSSGDNTAQLWDVATRREIAVFRGHRGSVRAWGFSPDGKLVVTSSGDNTVKLWDVAAQREVATVRGYKDSVDAVAFSPHGQLLAINGDDTLKLWELSSRRFIATFKSQIPGVWSMMFSPDGKLLAAGSWIGVTLWDTTARREIATLKGHAARVSAIAFSPDGQTLASASADSTIKLWDVGTRQERMTFRGHRAPVLAVAFSPDGKHLASGGEDGTVKVWDTASRENMPVLNAKEWVGFVATSPDGKSLASGGFASSTVSLWDLGSRRRIAFFRGHGQASRDAAFSPDGAVLAVASGRGSEQATPGEVILWDVATRREIATLKGHEAWVTAVAFSPDGKLLATGSNGNDVRLWDQERSDARGSRKELATLRGFTGVHDGLAFSPDGKLLAGGAPDSTVNLWDVQSRRRLAALRGHTAGIHSVAFSPDGKLLASASYDATTRLWNVAARQEVATLKGHSGSVWGLAFAPDGKTLATCGSDRTIKLWNVASQQEVATLKGHTAPVDDVAFTPDGQTLASGGDTTVRLWRAPPVPQTMVQDDGLVHSLH